MKQITLEELGYLAKSAKGQIDKLYLHWTAGWYGQYFDDYHVMVDENGEVIVSTYDLTERKSHTWKRNTNAVGISMCCCVGAQANNGYDTNFGENPPTQKQIEGMAKVVAVLCENLGLEITAKNVLTHCEAALLDGYGPYQGDPDLRWDLWYLPDDAQNNTMISGGDVIRGKAIWFAHNK